MQVVWKRFCIKLPLNLWSKFLFYTPWKKQKTFSFLNFSWGYKIWTLVRNGIDNVDRYVEVSMHKQLFDLNLETTLQRCSWEKGVLKIYSQFKGKHSCKSVISIKLLCSFIEITLQHGCSSVNLRHIFRIPFPKNTSVELLLSIYFL